jgi:protocatechuate 3,4-dioxygenase beta subunit
MYLSRLAVSLSLLVVLSPTALGQSDRASVRGLVLDPSGAPIPGVGVRITNEGTGETRSRTTDPSGVFAATSLPPGAYRIEASQTDYACRSIRSCGSRSP